MSPEKEEKLFKDFPKIFPNGRNVDPRANLMCFGFECGDGWFDVIYDMCEHIQNHVDRYRIFKGGKREDAGAWVPAQIVAIQVKEKYGTLRFYCSGEALVRANDDPLKDNEEALQWLDNGIVTGIIAHATFLSGKTCEECGAKGHVRGYGWVRCLCSDCAKNQMDNNS